MKYLLDTDVVIDHLRGKQEISSKFISAGLALSIISYAELLYGANKSRYPRKTEVRIRSYVKDLSIKIVNLNHKVIELFARDKAILEVSGQKLDNFDLLIGSTAKHKFLTLVTGNIKHFKRIPGLKVKSIT